MNRWNLIRRFLEFSREMGREKQLAKINFVVLTSTDAARIVPRNENRRWTVESIFSMVSMVLLDSIARTAACGGF
jgi:hypothetical protein